MRKSLTLLTITSTLALAACGSESSTSFETEDGETGEYSVNSETGEASVTLETDGGTATMRSGAAVPVDLPEGFSIYPGADVISNTVYSQGDSKGALVTMLTQDSPEEIADYYRAEAEAAGVDIQMEMSVNDGKMVGGEAPGGLTFSVNATPGAEGTTAQLVVGKDLNN